MSVHSALRVVLLLAAVSLPVDGVEPSTSHEAKNMKNQYAAIRAANESYKYQASLWWDADSSPYCGAALVDERNLVTAAHCIFDGVLALMRKPSNFLRVSVGCTGYEKCTKHEVGYTYVHPHYNYRTLENDIAVVKLKQPLTLGEDVQLVGLAAVSPTPGEQCELSGWGAWSSWSYAMSSELQRSAVTVQPVDTCFLIRGRRVIDNRLCVTSEPGSTHLHADSGGPVTCSEQLAGVVVGADRDAGALVLTAVAPHAGFVRECVGDWGRSAWPLSTAIWTGVAEAALSLLVTALLARLSSRQPDTLRK